MTNTPPPPPPGPSGPAPSFGQLSADGPGPGSGRKRKRTLLVTILSVIGVVALAAVSYFVVLPATGLMANETSNGEPVARKSTSPSPQATPAPTQSPSASGEPEEAKPSVAMASAVPSRKPSASPSPSPTPEPSESSDPSSPLEGDLGLSTPITQLDCTDQYVVFYASSFVPELYGSEVQGALDTYPGTEYVRSLGSCTTLNQMSDHDTFIYSVYSGPYDTLSEACSVSASSADSYVKVLSDGVDPDDAVMTC